MRLRRSCASGLVLLGVLGLPAVWAARGLAERRALDPDVAAVRLLLGVGDTKPMDWSGRVGTDKGEVVGVEGWRFRDEGKVTGPDAWEAKSLLIRRGVGKKKAARKKAAMKKATGPGNTGPAVTPNGVIVTLKSPDDATLSVETAQGKFAVRLADLADGAPHRVFGGRVEAQRIPPGTPLVEGPDQEDFPSAAADSQGGLWVAYVVHKARGPEASEALTSPPKSFKSFIPTGGGDQVRLLRFADGKAGEPLDVTVEGLDVWRPAVAVDGRGKVVVVWSENREGNWDLFRRDYDPETMSWSDPARLTTDPATDTHAVLATAPDGRVWMAWQGWAGGQADIRLAPVGHLDQAVNVSANPANEWTPALAIDKSGRFHIAYDTYQAGNYDVMLRTVANGKLGEPVRIASTPKYEARPTLAADAQGRVWIAYEERDVLWGKDAATLTEGEGATLYRSSAVRVRCLDGTRLLDVADPLAKAAERLRPFNGFPRLAADRSGRVWLAFRHREEAIWGQNAVMVVGAVWLEYASALSGQEWAPPQVLPRSDGLLDNRPALVAMPDGPVMAVYNTDARLRHEIEHTPDLTRRFYTHSGTPAGIVNNDIEVAALTSIPGRGAAEPAGPLVAAAEPEPVAPIHPNESADADRVRAHRVQAGGKTYQLLRGEFHRHTELSQDGGSDGALEDMWRYALDAARLDWVGNGDHDNGGGKEYTWWLVQKTTDLYHNPPSFVPMFSYERSVPYPGGHRNVMWAKRGVRTLPRLIDEDGVRMFVRGKDEDARMLHDYLNELDGICASHSTGTGMGTDWRANDPRAEPIVEIFQGHRNSYEHLGAPRVARRAAESNGGWKPLGMVWNALAMQYRLGFQASSDHISTHMSFAVALAERPDRAAILDAFRRRHCYGATDNLVLDVRSGEHLMGDEFDADGPVRLKVFAQGTAPIARVDIIKDFVYVYSTEPHQARVALTWTDEERRPPGLSWYYVRVLQEDGGLAWGSPMWVHRRGEAAGE